MIRRTALTLVLGAATAFSQDIPDRPEKLSFAPIRFETPRARDYKARLRNGIPAFVAPNGKEGTPLVRVTVSWRGGAYLDAKGKEGLAGLFGSQLAQGGASSRSSRSRTTSCASTRTGSSRPSPASGPPARRSRAASRTRPAKAGPRTGGRPTGRRSRPSRPLTCSGWPGSSSTPTRSWSWPWARPPRWSRATRTTRALSRTWRRCR